MENVDLIVKELKVVSQKHHQAYLTSHGVDSNWARWYAEKLTKDTIFEKSLKHKMTKAKLAETLVKCDSEFKELKLKTDWTNYFATRIIEES